VFFSQDYFHSLVFSLRLHRQILRDETLQSGPSWSIARTRTWPFGWGLSMPTKASLWWVRTF